MKTSRYSLILLLVLATNLCSSLSAQTGTIRGFVYEKDSGEPVIFTNVWVKGTQFGTSSDVNGYYCIPKLPSGNFILMTASLEFDTLETPFTIIENQIVTEKLLVNPQKKILPPTHTNVDINCQRTSTSILKISPEDIKKLPTIGGAKEISQYLKVLGCMGGNFGNERTTCPVLEQDRPKNKANIEVQ